MKIEWPEVLTICFPRRQYKNYIDHGACTSDGNSLEAQEKLLIAAGAEIIFKDAFTGTKADRSELDKLKAILKKGDKVIVTKLDRLARSTEDGLNLVKHWY